MKKKFKVKEELRCKEMSLHEHLKLAGEIMSMTPEERRELDNLIRIGRSYEMMDLMDRVLEGENINEDEA